jgi:photosystem II stability/assembly factor-like uncharacterized protein
MLELRNIPIRRAAVGLTLAAALGAASGCSKHLGAPYIVPPLASVSLAPDTLVIVKGETDRFTVTARDSSGNPVVGFHGTWSTDDVTHLVLSVAANGLVTADGEGSAFVRFTSTDGVRDSAVVVVIPAVSGWFIQPSNANNANLNGVFFNADGRNGWAVGDGGRIVHTSDAGESWTAQISSTGFNLNGVWFTSATTGWAVGAGGTVINTTDGGAHWARLTNVGASENLMDVCFATDSMGWAVGANGAVVRTRNAGASWQLVHPTAFTLQSVSFPDTANGWAVGDNGVIVGTHNGGASWFVVQPSVTASPLKGVWRRSEALAWAVGASGATPRTQAGADSTEWRLRSTGASYQLEGVIFVTNLTGFAVGFNGVGSVLRSDDGGTNWTAQISFSQYRLNDVFFVDASRGWAVGDNGTIIHTGTGGQP